MELSTPRTGEWLRVALGVRFATPITSALHRDRSIAYPKTMPLSFWTSWPSGNSEARMSSRVTAWPPDFIGKSDEGAGVHVGDGIGIGDAFGFPYVDRIGAGTESL